MSLICLRTVCRKAPYILQSIWNTGLHKAIVFASFRAFVILSNSWLCRISTAGVTDFGIPPARTAESLGLLQGEVGVEYSNADQIICARVHSIRTAESTRTVATRRPVDAFDRHTLYVYGDGDKKTLFTAWTGKILGYTPVDCRRRTTWFTDDLARRSLAGDLNLQEFVLACPTTNVNAANKAKGRARPTTTRPVSTLSPAILEEHDEFMDDYYASLP